MFSSIKPKHDDQLFVDFCILTVFIVRTILWSLQINASSSYFGLIKENINLSRIHLPVLLSRVGWLWIKAVKGCVNRFDIVALKWKTRLNQVKRNCMSYVCTCILFRCILLNLIFYKIDWHVSYSISCIGGIKTPSGATSRKCWAVITEMRYGFNISNWNFRSAEDRKYFILQRISPFLGLQQSVKKWNKN